MAKKKTFENTEDQLLTTSDKEATNNAQTSENKQSVSPGKGADDVMTADTLPLQAIDYLKRHTEVEALYIDKRGGLFPIDTPHVFVREATLYQNPYYKK